MCELITTVVHFINFRLYVQWRFMRGIEAQFLALQKGFNEIIPPHLLKSFDERELEVSFVTQFILDCLWAHYWNI